MRDDILRQLEKEIEEEIRERPKILEDLNSILEGPWKGGWRSYEYDLDSLNTLFVEEKVEGVWYAGIMGEDYQIDQYVTGSTAEDCLTKLVSRIKEIHELLQKDD